MSDISNDDALKQAMMKPEDERTDEDWALLADAFASDKGHVEDVAHEIGTNVSE